MKAWYRLACRRAQHSILELGYTVVVLYVLSLKALRNKHHLLCTVSINSILAEALTVCLSSFFLKGNAFLCHVAPPTSTQDGKLGSDLETFALFWWFLAVSITILVSLLATTALAYTLRSPFVLPHPPETVASILAFAYQRRLLMDLLDKQEMPIDAIAGAMATRGELKSLVCTREGRWVSLQH